MHTALALALLLSAAPDAGAPRTGQEVLTARLPAYPGAPAPTRVGETMQANGVPMNLQSFVTTDEPHKVLDFYRHAFEQMHLPTLGNGDLMVQFPYPSVTAFDDADQVDLSVIAIRDAKNRVTTVLLALADIQGLHDNVERAVQSQFGGLPPYASAEGPQAMTATDGEQHHVVVTFATADAPEKVLGFYATALAKQGFQPAGAGSANELMVASATGRWYLVARRARGAQKTSVMATWSNQPQAEESP